MIRLASHSLSLTRALHNRTQAGIRNGREKVNPAIGKKDPNTQAQTVLRDSEKKSPGSEHQRIRTVLKGDAADAIEKAEKAGKPVRKDLEVRKAKDKLKESTFGTKKA